MKMKLDQTERWTMIVQLWFRVCHELQWTTTESSVSPIQLMTYLCLLFVCDRCRICIKCRPSRILTSRVPRNTVFSNWNVFWMNEVSREKYWFQIRWPENGASRRRDLSKNTQKKMNLVFFVIIGFIVPSRCSSGNAPLVPSQIRHCLSYNSLWYNYSWLTRIHVS